jgi:Protein of unknown function (DUF3795)
MRLEAKRLEIKLMITKASVKTNPQLIAPCGINCRLCRRHTRKKDACPGCRGDDSLKTKSCASCPIKSCEKLKSPAPQYCFGCDEFPCRRMKNMEKRYTAKYGVSLLGNLAEIRKRGIRAFVKRENEKWACVQCGEMLCMHKAQCLSCGYSWRE